MKKLESKFWQPASLHSDRSQLLPEEEVDWVGVDYCSFCWDPRRVNSHLQEPGGFRNQVDE